MSIGRCGTCKWAQDTPKPWWFGLPEEAEESAEVFGFEKFALAYPLRCELAEQGMGEAKHPGKLCVTIDGSMYRGELYVMPDFGCVQWEAKTDA